MATIASDFFKDRFSVNIVRQGIVQIGVKSGNELGRTVKKARTRSSVSRFRVG